MGLIQKVSNGEVLWIEEGQILGPEGKEQSPKGEKKNN